jgi:toxin ParE2
MIVDFLTIARSEFDAAVEYYDAELPGLGGEFITDVLQAIDRIRAFPQGWPPFHRGTRRCRLQRFPYGLIYCVEEDLILIVAVANLHRMPDYWVGRLDFRS